jgi:Flp pilus assembly protein TadD/4-amino-4-deoxy-L-arabinose transferase-like glycosyltransferase
MWRMWRNRSLWIFLAALALRLIYIAEIRDAPYFDVPLVDGANYVRSAETIASGDLLAGHEPFWQPPLYPYFLALLFGLFGPSLGLIYVVQAAIGALSCWLVHRIGRRVWGEREALWAGAITACYGPLIVFDAQPLIPVLHIFLTLAGLLFLLRAGGIDAAAPGGGRAGDEGEAGGARGDPAGGPAGVAVRGAGRWEWGLAGLLWGLSAAATPNILLAVPVAALWGLRRERAAGRAPRGRKAAGVALFLAGAALPVAAIAVRNLAVAGEPILISSNGGINFYIGNNPDYDQTIRIRPGGEFERLAQQPENLGIVGAAARSRYFAGRAIEFLRGYPGAALRLYAGKARDLFAGREIPRNQESYVYRRYSVLLSLLLWRFGVSFPFGVIAPLALGGALLAAGADGRGAAPRRAGAAMLVGYAAAYGASILLFFPTDRYRLPLIPVAALFAGRLLGAPWPRWRTPRVAGGLLAGLLLCNADALVAGESRPEEEALNRAYAFRVKGRIDEARREYRRAIGLNPRRIDPHNALAAMAAREGRWEEAMGHYRDLLEAAPDFVEVRRNLGQAYLALGRREEARREWETAVHLAPGAASPLTDLCLWHLDEKQPAVAEEYCRRAVRSRPDRAETHYALGLALRAQRKFDEAREALRESARLSPAGSEGRRKAEEILGKMRRRELRERQEHPAVGD